MENSKTVKDFWQKNKSSILYAISLAILLFFLKWLEIRFLIFDHSYEIYIGIIALLFLSLGIWLAMKLSKPKIETIFLEKEIYIMKSFYDEIDEELIAKLELSRRELDILGLIGLGNSNQDIANKLLISLSTVKTHNQNLFDKLEVKNRLQAVEKARRMKLIN